MDVRHKTPCKVCPWRRDSAPGWLGAATPQEFLDQTKAEVHMPCHKQVDYERADWRDQAQAGAFCAGALTFLANHCILPRDPELAQARRQVSADHGVVFSHSQQFLDHHSRKA